MEILIKKKFLLFNLIIRKEMNISMRINRKIKMIILKGNAEEPQIRLLNQMEMLIYFRKKIQHFTELAIINKVLIMMAGNLIPLTIKMWLNFHHWRKFFRKFQDFKIIQTYNLNQLQRIMLHFMKTTNILWISEIKRKVRIFRLNY